MADVTTEMNDEMTTAAPTATAAAAAAAVVADDSTETPSLDHRCHDGTDDLQTQDERCTDDRSKAATLATDEQQQPLRGSACNDAGLSLLPLQWITTFTCLIMLISISSTFITDFHQ